MKNLMPNLNSTLSCLFIVSAISISAQAGTLKNPSIDQLKGLADSTECILDTKDTLYSRSVQGYNAGDKAENDFFEDSFGDVALIIHNSGLGCIRAVSFEMTATYPTWNAAHLKGLETAEVYKIWNKADDEAKSRFLLAKKTLIKACSGETIEILNKRTAELNGTGKNFFSFICPEQ